MTVLGDVVISLDTAGRQAAERGYSLLSEARVLLVHGVLHLFGFDHEEGQDCARVLCGLGLGVEGALWLRGCLERPPALTPSALTRTSA